MNIKLPLIVALFGVLSCLSTAQEVETLMTVCPKKCTTTYNCSLYQKSLVWVIVNNNMCRVYQNNCLFNSLNCLRANNCQFPLVSTTREKCRAYCPDTCAPGGPGVCASIPVTSANGTNSISKRFFINRCLALRYSCTNAIAFVGVMTEGECPK